MNTLTLIKKQIEKASALHDAQIAMTSYRGVKYECQQGIDEIHGTFCYRGHTYNKQNHASTSSSWVRNPFQRCFYLLGIWRDTSSDEEVKWKSIDITMMIWIEITDHHHVINSNIGDVTIGRVTESICENGLKTY